MKKSNLLSNILEVLPQTQCQDCGYKDCETYAKAILHEEAVPTLCKPGGKEVAKQLYVLLGLTAAEKSLNSPVKQIIEIDESLCIGCTKCIVACPTLAIVGARGYMHEVINDLCTGCGLCVPVCPTNCIQLKEDKEKANLFREQNEDLQLAKRQWKKMYNLKQKQELHAMHSTATDENTVNYYISRAKQRLKKHD